MIHYIKDHNNINEVKTLSIETIDYCNRKCKWCPNSHRDQNPNNVMKDEVFEKIILELKSIDYKGAIHPYFRGEPLIDSTILSKIQRLRQEFPNNRIRLNTNGDYIRYYEDIKSILDSGVTAIHISHYEKGDLNKIMDKDFPGKVTHFGMKSLLPSFWNRAGNVELEDNKLYEQHAYCTYPILKIFILFNGNIVLCCSDWKEEVIFGNIMTEHLIDIWNKPEYSKYRKLHLHGEGKKMPLCSKCNLIQ